MNKAVQEGMSAEWLALSIKSAEIGAWLWDLENKNKEIVRTQFYDQVFGLKPEQIWTRDDWVQHIHPMEREATVAKMQSVIAGTTHEYHAEYRIIRNDGGIRWVTGWGKAIRDSDGKVARIAGVVQDITEAKKVRRDRDQFVATLSHDLRNPLAAALANVELVQKFPSQASVRANLLEKVVVAIERADRIIQDLLDSSRVESGHPMRAIIQTCDLRVMLLDAVGDLSLQYGDRFRLEMNGEFAGKWACDAVRRILENLATNAIKYGSAREPVRIELVRTENLVTLSVHNEGNPISPEDQKNLFEPFSQTGPAATSGQRGWGLGLTVVRSLAEALQGRVTVESSPSQGTTFRFQFPVPTAQIIAAAG